MFFSYGFVKIIDVIAETIDDVMSKTPEEVTELCEENDINPVDLMAIVNYFTREIREERPYFDPREGFDVVVPYLDKNGFIYDENLGAFRER